MVRVPIAPQVEAQVPQGPSGAPQFQAPPMPGMQESQQLAQDIGRAGQMAMDVQRDEQALALYQQRMAAKEKATQDALIAKRQAAIDESMVQQALTVTASQWDEILDIYGRAKGKAAIDRYQEALSALDAVSKATGDNLPEGLRQAYTMAAMQKQLIARRGINKHFGEQSDAWDTNTKREWIDSLKNDAVAGYDTLDDPSGVYATSMGAAMKAVEQIQAKFGETSNSPATMRFKREIWESVTTQVADNLIRDKDFAGAMKHVEDVAGAGMMSEAQLTKLRDAIETSEANSSALATADNLFERGATGSTKQFEDTTPEPGYEPLPTLPNGDPDIGAMETLIRDRAKADGRDEGWVRMAISQLNDREGQRVRDVQRRERADEDLILSVSHSPEAVSRGESQWKEAARRHPVEWARAPESVRQKAKVLVRATDPVVLEEIYREVNVAMERGEVTVAIGLARANRGNISEQDYQSLTGFIQAYGTEKAPAITQSQFAADAALRDFAPEILKKEDAKARFSDALRRRVEDYTSTYKEQPTPDWIRATANSMAQDKAQNAGWFGTTLPAAAMSFEQQAGAVRVSLPADMPFRPTILQQRAIALILAGSGAASSSPQQYADAYSMLINRPDESRGADQAGVPGQPRPALSMRQTEGLVAVLLMQQGVRYENITPEMTSQMIRQLREKAE